MKMSLLKLWWLFLMLLVCFVWLFWCCVGVGIVVNIFVFYLPNLIF